MSELANDPGTPSRLLELVHAYTQPRDEDDLAVAAPKTAPEPEPEPAASAGDERAGSPRPQRGTRQPGKSRRRHGSSKARRKPRTNDRAAAPGPRDAEAA